MDVGHYVLKWSNKRDALLIVPNIRFIQQEDSWLGSGREESAEHASELIMRTTMLEKVAAKQNVLVLHSDNGSLMKGATMLETLYSLGIVPSNSRPRVSNDNPYAESKYPERWTKGIRNWSLEDKVFLNPERVAKNMDKEVNEVQAS